MKTTTTLLSFGCAALLLGGAFSLALSPAWEETTANPAVVAALSIEVHR